MANAKSTSSIHSTLNRPRWSATQAMAGLCEGYRMFEAEDPTNPLDPATKDRRRHKQMAIDKVALTHGVTAERDRLGVAIAAASEAYWLWWVKYARATAGLGSRVDIESLRTALNTAEKQLSKETVRNRLEEIAQFSKNVPVGPSAPLHYRYGDAIFESVRHARATINGLRVLVEQAAWLDGRAHSASRRDDIRVAARPLRDFWTSIPSNTGKLGQQGQLYYPAVKFLYACLSLIDYSVTLRLIADLDT